MKYISLAVMAVLSTASQIKSKDMELEEPSDIAAA